MAMGLMPMIGQMYGGASQSYARMQPEIKRPKKTVGGAMQSGIGAGLAGMQLAKPVAKGLGLGATAPTFASAHMGGVTGVPGALAGDAAIDALMVGGGEAALGGGVGALGGGAAGAELGVGAGLVAGDAALMGGAAGGAAGAATTGAATTIGSSVAGGAATGSAAGPWGAAIGAAIGIAAYYLS